MTDWMIDTLWATTLLMALVLVLRTPVAKLFGSRVAYALWLIPAARLFMPTLTETIEVAAPAPMPVETMPVSAMAATPAPIPVESGPDWFMMAMTLWIGGAVLFLIWRTAAYIQEREDLLTDARDVGDVGGIRLIEAPLAQGPIAMGLIRRYIAVPSDFFRHYSERERDLALAHELSHHRSGDLAVNILAFAMLSLHWFNPVAWLAWRAFRFDQEAACDARVLAARSEEDKQVYGKTVAKAASGRALLFASALNNRDQLKKRLRMMKEDQGSGKRWWTGMLGIGGAIAIALPLTATVSYAVVQAPTPPQAPEAPAAPDAPNAPFAPTAIAYQTGDEAGDYEYVVEGDDGERHTVRVSRDGNGRMTDFDREELRRSLAEIPSREELMAMIPSREELRAMVPDDAELRAMIPDIQIGDGCDGSGEPVIDRSRRGANGHETVNIQICREAIADLAMNGALMGMREARTAIARDPDLTAEERTEALTELDRAIARMSR